MPTHTTRSRRICLINPLNADAQSRRLLAEIAGELPMRPLADLLIGPFAQADPRLDVTHIPHGDLTDTLLRAEIHDLARRLMQEVPLLAGESGARLGFAPVESLCPP